MRRHDKRNIALYHPYSSWCASEEVSMKYWEVRFIERRAIVGVITSPDSLENKFVTKLRIMVLDEDLNWIVVRSRNRDVSYNRPV